MNQKIPETPPDFDETRMVERPDGFYWQSKAGGREYGPFGTLLEAMEDMQQVEEDSMYEPGESLDEAREELGLSDWVDPDTGELAEEDSTRIEDH